MKLTLHGSSTARYATWFFIEELNLLFDAGDGVSAALISKSGKVKHAFISHADRDHLGGLLQFNQLNARNGNPKIYYPKDSGSFPALKEFFARFDPHISEAEWLAIEGGMEIPIRDDLFVEVIRNNHVQAPPEIQKSFSFKVFQTKRKLKPEFTSLAGAEIGRLTKEHGKDHTTTLIKNNIISYAGDTPIDDWQRFDGSNILIHESTFIDGLGEKEVVPHGNKHSTLQEVMEMAANIELEGLVLNHFSSRYKGHEIRKAVLELIVHYGIKIPVWAMEPGVVYPNVLVTDAVNC